jgi:NhaP-type Na+/H+ or K+/H+ antiporter
MFSRRQWLALWMGLRQLAVGGALGAGVGPAAGVDAVLDCGVRALGLAFGQYLLPGDAVAASLLFDALRLGVDCNATAIAAPSGMPAALAAPTAAERA